MNPDKRPLINLRGTPASVQMAVLETGVEEQDLIIGIDQPPPNQGGALTIGVNHKETSPNALRQMLQRHHVRRRHIKLITAYYEADRNMRQGDPPQTEEAPTRIFLVPARKPSPDLKQEPADA